MIHHLHDSLSDREALAFRIEGYEDARGFHYGQPGSPSVSKAEVFAGWNVDEDVSEVRHGGLGR